MSRDLILARRGDDVHRDLTRRDGLPRRGILQVTQLLNHPRTLLVAQQLKRLALRLLTHRLTFRMGGAFKHPLCQGIDEKTNNDDTNGTGENGEKIGLVMIEYLLCYSHSRVHTRCS